MHLDVGSDRTANRMVSRILLAQQLALDRAAGVVLSGEGEIEVVDACEDAGGEQRRTKSGTLLVGPVHDLERVVGRYLSVVQCAQNFECSKNADRPVETTRHRLAVKMTADQDGRPIGASTRPASEHVADAVDPDTEPGRLAP